MVGLSTHNIQIPQQVCFYLIVDDDYEHDDNFRWQTTATTTKIVGNLSNKTITSSFYKTGTQPYVYLNQLVVVQVYFTVVYLFFIFIIIVVVVFFLFILFQQSKFNECLEMRDMCYVLFLTTYIYLSNHVDTFFLGILNIFSLQIFSTAASLCCLFNYIFFYLLCFLMFSLFFFVCKD